LGQLRAIGMLRRAAPDRVGIFDLENSQGTPIYVHAKICIIDDTWFTCGSDNFNRRSWTTDSELTCAVMDTSADGMLPAGSGTLPTRPRATERRLQLGA
jgi:phosphatidylserine/phosphatidylglycerophosphate/cardiolipin synthase-like enzyme